MKKQLLLVCTLAYMLMCNLSANAQCGGTLKISRSGPVNYNYCTDGQIDIYLSGVGAGWNFAIYKDTINPANKISGTSSVFDMPFSNTIYYGTADSAGCTQKIDSLIVTVNTTLVITAGPNTTICSGDSVQLNASFSGLVTYSWTGPNGFTSTSQNPKISSATTSATGTYTITGTNQMCAGEATCTIIVNPGPVANFSISADTSQLHHYIVVNNSSGTAPLSYIWDWGDGLYDTIPYPTHTYAASGFYNICLTVIDSNGCSNTFCDSSFHILRTTNYMIYITVVPPIITVTEAINISTPQVIISPNPATNQLTIHTSSFHPNEAATVSIMNVLGQTSPPAPLQRRGEHAVIDVSKLAAGMYFVQLKTESGSVVKRFVKE